MALAWALALSPLAGIMALNALFDKDLVGERYVFFAVPALVVLMTHKLGDLRPSMQGFAYCVAAILWSSQLVCANWGYERTDGRIAGRYRSLAKAVEAAGIDSSALFAGIEYGGTPGSLVYELPESLPVLFLGVDNDPLEAAAVLDRYEFVWQVVGGGPTLQVENAVASRLLQLGRTPQPFPDAVLYRRQDAQHDEPTVR